MAKVKVDFSKVEESGGIRVAETDYRVKIVNSELRDSSNGNSMIKWTFEFLDGKHAGRTITTNTVLMAKSLWVLRKLLEATGAKVPKSMKEIDTKKYHGRELGITCTDNEYEDKNGKTRISSEVSDFLDVDAVKDYDEDDDDLEGVEEPKKDKKKGKKGKKTKEEPEPVAKSKKGKEKTKKKGKKKGDDDTVEEMDLDEL